jgi:hypothetical protein
MFLTMALVLGAAPQEEKKNPPFDPFADPAEELMKRAERTQKEEAGGKDVISAKLWSNLDRAEKLVKTIREKAK